VRKRGDRIVYSATDLANYLQCEHLATLDLVNLETPLPKKEDDEQAKMIQRRGFDHEAASLESFRTEGLSVVEISTEGAIEERARRTREVLVQDAEVIYQAAFAHEEFVGIADFLRRVDRPSKLGAYSFEVVESKLARSPKTQFIIQLCLYSGASCKIPADDWSMVAQAGGARLILSH